MSRSADLVVARDAEIEGRHELAEQLRDVDCEWRRATHKLRSIRLPLSRIALWANDKWMQGADWLYQGPMSDKAVRERLRGMGWRVAWNDEPL